MDVFVVPVILLAAAALGWWGWRALRARTAAPEDGVRVEHHLFPEVTERVLEEDAFEGSFWEVEDPLPVRAALAIRYCDANRLTTHRTIRVHQFGAFGATSLLIAHCEPRDAMRTFRVDRIESCSSVDTGTLIDDVAGFLRARYLSHPVLARERLATEAYDALRILLYLGQANGLDIAERTIIRDTCRKLAGDTLLSPARIDALYHELDAPTGRAFQQAVARLADRSPEGRIAIMVAAKRIAAGKAHEEPVTQQALAYLQQRLFNTRGDALPALG